MSTYDHWKSTNPEDHAPEPVDEFGVCECGRPATIAAEDLHGGYAFRCDCGRRWAEEDPERLAWAEQQQADQDARDLVNDGRREDD